MNLLLDTHAFLWWWTDDPKLGAEARDAVAQAVEVHRKLLEEAKEEHARVGATP